MIYSTFKQQHNLNLDFINWIVYLDTGGTLASVHSPIYMNISLQMGTFRTLFAKIISDKHDDVMAKFGAIIAQGIIDAG